MGIFGKSKAKKEEKKDQKEAGSKAADLGIAMSVKGRKKYAKGGQIPQSAAQRESRPNPDQTANDAHSVARNETKKALVDSSWTSRPDIPQTAERKKGTQPIAEPSMPKGATFQVRSNRMQDELKAQERNQMQSMAPGNPGAQPKAMYDEPVKPGNGPIPAAQRHFAEGGEVERRKQMDPNSLVRESEIQSQTDIAKRKAMDPHSPLRMAEGGVVEQEREIMEAASIAAAIMARRRMAKGGMVDQADLTQNAIEHGNEADQLNMDALGKEIYDESSALDAATQPEDSNLIEPEHDEENIHDKGMIGEIRSKMKKRSPITK